MSLAKNPLRYTGVRPKNPPNVQLALINPTTQDDFVKGDIWLNTVLATCFMWSGNSWIAMGSGASGGVVTVTADSGGPLSPVAGDIILAGTTNEITTAGAGHTVTFSLPATVIAPGSIASTTTMTSGTGITATTGNIVASAGNISATLGSVAAATTVTAGTDLVATAGNVLINGSAKQLRVKGGAATDFIGTATLVNGTVTIANTNIAATDRIFVERSAVNASTALGVFKVVKTPATNFVITACKPADATTETGDASDVEYFIVRQV